jgi:putative spermidine/putrescine transport system ATP-binding protein
MSKGRIAQVGTPRDIYFTPCNRFVAEFIGAANIIESPVQNGHLVLPGGRQPVTGQADLAAVVAMVRPESIRVEEAGAAALSGTIDSVAFNGEKQRLVVGGAADKPLTVDAPNTLQVKPGERVGLSISPEAVRLLPPED